MEIKPNQLKYAVVLFVAMFSGGGVATLNQFPSATDIAELHESQTQSMKRSESLDRYLLALVGRQTQIIEHIARSVEPQIELPAESPELTQARTELLLRGGMAGPLSSLRR